MRSNAVWTARSDNGSRLEWIAATTNTAYLLGYTLGEYNRIAYDSPPRIRQLDLETGKWLADLPLPVPAAAFETKAVLEILTGSDNRVVVLTGLSNGQSSNPTQPSIQGYGLSIFNEREKKPLWTKQFASQGERPYTGGYVWGVPAPAYSGSSIRRLNWLGERLLVCPEAMQPLYCLNPDTGSELWRVERIWEFQRGFIGPSVWAHYISRFGIEDFWNKSEPTNLIQLRKDFDEKFQCALTGGPAVVPLHFERDEDAHSVFLTTVKGPAKQWAGYLSDCVVYELGEDGKPVSMGTLPQMTDGSKFCTHNGDVIWKCQHESFICLRPVRTAPMRGMSISDNSDGLFNLAWSRRISYEPPKAWLLTGKNGEPAAFGDSWAYCVPGGGYVLQEQEKQFRFPIAALNLSSGEDISFALSVPFDGNIVLPESNIGTETRGDKKYYTTVNPLGLALTYLEAHGNELDVTVATETNRWTLSFDLGEAFAAAIHAPSAKESNALNPKP